MAKQIKKPLELSKEEQKYIDEVVASYDLDDRFEKAKAGDIDAAWHTLLPIAHFLDPKCDQPIPVSIRQYLSDAFREILAGTSADKALNLKAKKGRPKTPYKLMLKVAYLVYQGVYEHSLTVEEAVAETTLSINDNLKDGAWYLLKEAQIQEGLVRKWYYFCLSDLEEIYLQKRDSRVTKVPRLS